MKRRPLRRLVRAERRVAAVLRGTGPLHRAGRAFRQPPSAEQRQEARARRFLQGWSQRKGGGWSIREAPWKPRVPETPCALPEAPQEWGLPLVPWGWETGEPWQRLIARLRRVGTSVKTWLRHRWRHLRYAEPLPPAREPTKTERVVGWSLAAAGVLLLTLILPRHVALWCAPLLGMAQMQLLDTGDSEEDHHGDKGRVGGQKLNQNMMLTLMCAATLNVGWFASDQNRGTSLGLTAPQIIQAAIDYGVANGFDAAWIPKKAAGVTLLPFPADQITFNNALHMLREGGPTSLDQFDTHAYGAAGNDSADDVNAVQATLDAAGASSPINGCKTIYIPGGRHRYSKPLWVTGNGIQISGNSQGYGTNFIGTASGASALVSTHRGVGMLIAAATATTQELVAPLVGGVGNSFHNANQFDAWWNLRDSRTLDLNGLSQFCVECFFRGTSTSATLLSSFGKLYSLDTESTGFLLFIEAAGKAQFQLNLSGGFKFVTDPSATITDGQIHHVAGSYDGATLRLFVDGNLVASTAASGTILQSFHEDVLLGPRRGCAEQNLLYNGALGDVYSPRVSSIARRTAPFTPPAGAHTVDANTLGLLNFDNQRGPMTRMETAVGDVWIAERTTVGIMTNSYGIRLKGLVFDTTQTASAVHIFPYGHCEWFGVNACDFLNHRHAILAADVGNRFQWKIERVVSQSHGSFPSRRSIVLGINSGIGTLQNVWFFGDPFGLQVSSGAVSARNVFYNASSFSIVPYVLFGANQSDTPTLFDSVHVNTESGVNAAWVADLIVSGGGSHLDGVLARGCVFEHGGTTQPFIIADLRATAIRFTGCNFRKLSHSPAFVMKYAAPLVANAALFEQCDQPDGWIPWCDTPGGAAVGSLGKGAAIPFATPLTLDCSLRDDFEVAALTGAITINFSNVTPGQKISLWTVQNGGGGNAITFGTVAMGYPIGAPTLGSVKGGSANDTTGNHYSQYVFEANLNGNLTQIGFSSGA